MKSSTHLEKAQAAHVTKATQKSKPAAGWQLMHYELLLSTK
jgi:hypothetical protein